MTANTNTITVTTALKAINALVIASISYDAALDTVRTEYKADRLTRDDARVALAMAYCHHAKKYNEQRDVETGKPVRNTALEKKVNRDLAAITAKDDADKVSAKSKRENTGVPEGIPADVWNAAMSLINKAGAYDCDTRKLVSTAIATAFAATK